MDLQSLRQLGQDFIRRSGSQGRVAAFPKQAQTCFSAYGLPPPVQKQVSTGKSRFQPELTIHQLDTTANAVSLIRPITKVISSTLQTASSNSSKGNSHFLSASGTPFHTERKALTISFFSWQTRRRQKLRSSSSRQPSGGQRLDYPLYPLSHPSCRFLPPLRVFCRGSNFPATCSIRHLPSSHSKSQRVYAEEHQRKRQTPFTNRSRCSAYARERGCCTRNGL